MCPSPSCSLLRCSVQHVQRYQHKCISYNGVKVRSCHGPGCPIKDVDREGAKLSPSHVWDAGFWAKCVSLSLFHLSNLVYVCAVMTQEHQTREDLRLPTPAQFAPFWRALPPELGVPRPRSGRRSGTSTEAASLALPGYVMHHPHTLTVVIHTRKGNVSGHSPVSWKWQIRWLLECGAPCVTLADLLNA